MHAIEAYAGRPLTVLLGGTDRGLDYAPLREFLADRELTVIGLPDSGPRILGELTGSRDPPGERRGPAGGRPPGPQADPARRRRPALPAAPSYGRFRNFEHRSEVFAQSIRETA